ncbi:MAG: hypothetical protein NTW21_27390 [Verrucomicrobia bacterium]|nr:hypothetical protein [Verrucomicrobiota bacterium]
MKRLIPGIVLGLVAGCLMLGIAGRVGWLRVMPPREQLGNGARTAENAALRDLRLLVRAQEDMMAEHEKILNTIIRAKSAIHHEPGEAAVDGDDLEEKVSQADRELIDWMSTKLRRMESRSVSVHLDHPSSTVLMGLHFHAPSLAFGGHRPPLQSSSSTSQHPI